MSVFRFTASGRSLVIECGSCGSPAVAVAAEAIDAPCETCSARMVGWRLRTRRGESREVSSTELDPLLVRERRIDRIASARQPEVLDLPLDPTPTRLDRLEGREDRVARPSRAPASVARPLSPPAPAAMPSAPPVSPVRPTPDAPKRGGAGALAVWGLVALVLVLLAKLVQGRDPAPADPGALGSTPAHQSPARQPPSGRSLTESASADRSIPAAPPAVTELDLQPELRTDIEVVGWSRDEETFVLDLTYQLDGNPNRWRARARVDAAGEQVLEWQDLSTAPARIAAPEHRGPAWNEAPSPQLDTDQLVRGSVIDPSTVDVRWCNKESSQFPTRLDVLDQAQAVLVTWGSDGEAINAADCEASDAGWLFVRAGQPTPGFVLQWHVPSAKRGATAIRVYRSPSQSRAVMVVADRSDDRLRVRFYSRLWGPQVFILHDRTHPELAQSLREQLGRPALYLSNDPDDPVFADHHRTIVVRASAPEPVMALARSISSRLGLPVESIDFDDRGSVKALRGYAVADILIIYCDCPEDGR